jgi:ubiquinone/menaquinone biosynthesis C-methylase UbiE
MLKLAKKNVPKAKFYRMDMRKLNLRRNSFNAITSMYAIIHVPRKYQPGIFKEFNALLKSKGFLLVSVGRTPLAGEIEENWLGAKMYWSQFGIKKDLQLIRKAGFKVLWHRLVGSKNDKCPIVLAQKAS